MKFELPTIAYDPDISEFFGVARRKATPEEARIWERDEVDETVFVYETPPQDGLRIKLRYVNSLLRVRVDLYLNDRSVCDYAFNSAKILVENPAKPNLVIFSGNNALEIYKTPWRLSSSDSTFYMNTSSDGDDWPPSVGCLTNTQTPSR